jgi:hypothetical protein
MRKIKRKRKVGLVRQRRKNSKLETSRAEVWTNSGNDELRTSNLEFRISPPRDSLSAAPHDDFKHSLPR